ncbi:MAG: hypothetical protein HY763_17175 [Planctomycetes bacterium]|nr:hypothetical protein [Planctomycetota bacterium]
MSRQALLSIAVTVMAFGMGSAAFGGARIDLRPTPPMPPGGYAPNTNINVDVFMVDTGNPQGDIPFRGLALDLADTSGTLRFPGVDGVSGTADDDMFLWEVLSPDFNATGSHLPYAWWALTREPPDPQYSITLPDGDEVRLGGIPVDVGAVGGVLDVMNADQPPFRGASASGGFFPEEPFDWYAHYGDLSGGKLEVVVIPEPGCAMLGLGLLAFRLARGAKRRAYSTRALYIAAGACPESLRSTAAPWRCRRLAAFPALTVALATAGGLGRMSTAGAYGQVTGVSGSVRGYGSPGTASFDPTNPQLVALPMGVLQAHGDFGASCVEAGCSSVCALTDTDGVFVLAAPGGQAVSVHGSLKHISGCSNCPATSGGPWVAVLNCQDGSACAAPRIETEPDCAEGIPASDPPAPTTPLVFNDPTVVQVDEYTTAQVNCFHHVSLAHDFYKSRQTDFTGIDFPVTCRVNLAGGACGGGSTGTSSISFDAGGVTPSGALCRNAAYSTLIAHEYAHVLLTRIGIPNNTNPRGAFHEGFADAFSLLLYNVSAIGEDHCGAGTVVRNYGMTGGCPRITYPCSSLAPPGGGCSNECYELDFWYGCGKLLAGVWQEVRLNGSPLGPCGVEWVRQLFTDWSRVTVGPEPPPPGIAVFNTAWPQTACEVLCMDDGGCDCAGGCDCDDPVLANGTPHDCLICDAFLKHNIDCPAMWDGNANRIPDQCEPIRLYGRCAETGPANRYISFSIPSPSTQQVALKVTRTFPLACNAGSAIGYNCASDADCPGSSLPGRCGPYDVGWVDAPDANGLSYLLPPTTSFDGAKRTWAAGAVHVGDCAIHPTPEATTTPLSCSISGAPCYQVCGAGQCPPGAGECITPPPTYEIRATADGTAFTPPITLSTVSRPCPKKWGDVVGVFDSTAWAWTAPNAVVNMNDINAVLLAFQHDPSAPHLTWVDLSPQVPNRYANMGDVQVVVQAFNGLPYNYAVHPAYCETGIIELRTGSGEGQQVSLHLVPAAVEGDAGRSLSVDVFSSEMSDLGAYEIGLQVTPEAEAKGEWVLDNITIDTSRENFAFAKEEVLTAVDLVGGRCGAVLLSGGGVSVFGPAYLATFTFRASPDAVGAFAIRLNESNTQLLTSAVESAPLAPPAEASVSLIAG